MTTNDIETVVRFENVGLRYGLGPEVLQDVTFSLAAGSFHFLVGDSGAGKSASRFGECGWFPYALLDAA